MASWLDGLDKAVCQQSFYCPAKSASACLSLRSLSQLTWIRELT